MKKSYHIEIGLDLYIRGDSAEDAIEKAKQSILREGLEISTELEGDDQSTDEDFEEAQMLVHWDLSLAGLGLINSLN